MALNRDSLIENIHKEAAGLMSRAKDLEWADDKAFLRDVLAEFEESFISIVSLGNPDGLDPPSGDVDPDLITDFSERMSCLNSIMGRASSLVAKIVSTPGKVLMGVISNWVTKTLAAIMPGITRFLKLQSWSFGISAAGFATITWTFGP